MGRRTNLARLARETTPDRAPAIDAPAHPPVPIVPPSTLNRQRARAAIQAGHRAQELQAIPPADFCSRVLRPLEVRDALADSQALLEPGPLVQGGGEAVPALSEADTDGSRDQIIDTLERPTTVSVRASEQRLELLERLGILQAGMDAAITGQARNSVERMLCHQLAASHVAALNLLAFMPGLQPDGSKTGGVTSPVEMAKLGNAAARLMEAFFAGCQALQKLKTRGTQRVIVQHQQLVVARDGAAVVVNQTGRGGRPAHRSHRGK